jgi:hypothetical protein
MMGKGTGRAASRFTGNKGLIWGCWLLSTCGFGILLGGVASLQSVGGGWGRGRSCCKALLLALRARPLVTPCVPNPLSLPACHAPLTAGLQRRQPQRPCPGRTWGVRAPGGCNATVERLAAAVVPATPLYDNYRYYSWTSLVCALRPAVQLPGPRQLRPFLPVHMCAALQLPSHLAVQSSCTKSACPQASLPLRTTTPADCRRPPTPLCRVDHLPALVCVAAGARVPAHQHSAPNQVGRLWQGSTNCQRHALQADHGREVLPERGGWR